MNILPSNIFVTMLLHEIFRRNCQAGFGGCEHGWVKDVVASGTQPKLMIKMEIGRSLS